MLDPGYEGLLVAGKYRVERVIGQGGMGVVVVAEQLQLGRKVAVKLLHPEACEHAPTLVRLLGEARAVAQIRSEHVAQVIDVIGVTEGGSPCIVMEYLEGQDLSQVLLSRGPLPLDEVVGYILQACEAIAEAHARGIVHRDLKPSNLFLTRRADGSPLVKVLDFGISKVLDPASAHAPQRGITESSVMLGSPAYMSPEQVRCAKSVDVRSDIWSLGIIIHELLTGSPAYVGNTHSAVLAMIVADPPPRLRVCRPDLPAVVEACVLKCLAKSPADRFQNLAELADVLSPFASGEACLSVERIRRLVGPALRSTGDGVTSLSAGGASAARRAPAVPRSSRGVDRFLPKAFVRRWGWAAAGAACLVVLVGVFGLGRGPRDSETGGGTYPVPSASAWASVAGGIGGGVASFGPVPRAQRCEGGADCPSGQAGQSGPTRATVLKEVAAAGDAAPLTKRASAGGAPSAAAAPSVAPSTAAHPSVVPPSPVAPPAPVAPKRGAPRTVPTLPDRDEGLDDRK